MTFHRAYPTVAETIETHRLLIEEFGGDAGIRDHGLLESAVLRPQTGYYSGVIEEAAALMESLVKNHPFIDGDKRVGFAMADALLRANGYFLEVEADAAFEFIAGALDRGEFRFDRIFEWMEPCVKVL